MLVAPTRKSFCITHSRAEADSILFYTRDYVLRISPQTNGIFRISLAEKDSFSPLQGEHLKNISPEAYSLVEDNELYKIITSSAAVTVHKSTCRIQAYDGYNNLVFSESNLDSKAIERFEAFRTKQTPNIRVEKIKTADGEKNHIVDGEYASDGYVYRTRLGLSFADDEVLIGLGQFDDGIFNLRGTTRYLHQANRSIVAPLMVSSKGYGLLLTTQSTAIFTDTPLESSIYCEAEEYLDYYLIIHEEPQDIIKGMRSLSGKARMLPKWAYGYLQSKERYETQQEILDTADAFIRKGLSLDAIILDWLSWGENQWGQKSFDLSRFPNPSEMIKELQAKGIHFMMSIWPNMAESTDDYKEFDSKNLLLPGTGIYNAFSEEGRAIYRRQLRDQLLKWGVESFWCDSSEPITPEWNNWFKKSPAQMYSDYVHQVSKSIPIRRLNSYGLYHAQTIFEEMSKLPNKRVCNLTRSGYPGSQEYGVILWSGDTDASWETLQRQLIAGISFSATGLPYWTFDIGAFFVKNGEPWYWRGDYPNGFEDEDYCLLYTRWFQLGAFLPIFRAHGTELPREPWAIGGDDSIYYRAIKKAIDIRYSLMPYIYTQAYRVWANDEQMMQPLCFSYPKDRKCWQVKDQYMLGPSLMICPIVSRSNTREVYFPAGQDWYDYFTGQKYKGGQLETITKNIDEIPVYVPENTLIPTTAPAPNTCSLSNDVIIKRFGEGPCSFELYNDSGDGYGYENGEFTLTEFH